MGLANPVASPIIIIHRAITKTKTLIPKPPIKPRSPISAILLLWSILQRKKERKTMEIDRLDGRTPNQLRPLACSRNVLNRAHGSASWCQGFSFFLSGLCALNFSETFFSDWVLIFVGDTKVLAAVYGPKAGTKKNENPEKACIEVIWKPKTGQSGEFLQLCLRFFMICI